MCCRLALQKCIANARQNFKWLIIGQYLTKFVWGRTKSNGYRSLGRKTLNDGGCSRLNYSLFAVLSCYSNFKFGTQLGLGRSIFKQLCRQKFAWVWARRASPKLNYPLPISATFEASDFKFSKQFESCMFNF